ncbi:MAG: alkaline phosphatase family protein [Clostridia bacterium]|nr:alkaline phosphatase family protein [Clostridia bacterium]
MKKKIIILAAVVLAIAAFLAFYFNGTSYKTDENDTESLFIENVDAIAYENTIETATAQTELYDIIYNHFTAPLPEGKTEKKAIVIGYDGCRADVLLSLQEENSGINALLEEGASINLNFCGGVNYPETNTQKTSTAPGWCSILTGKWADEHGITGNDITKTMDTKTLLTSLTEEKIIDRASFITKWAGHFDRNDATYLEEKAYCEKNGLNIDFNKTRNDSASLKAVVKELSEESCADFTIVIFEQTDSTGHGKGFSINNPKYRKAFIDADESGYETLTAIKNRATYETEDWLFIITSDHGGIGTGHGDASIQERMTFAVIK